MNAVARLRKFVERRAAVESCSICGIGLEERHPHLFETAVGKVRCSCRGCASVFPASTGKFRRVPDRVVRLVDLRLTEEQWAAFGIPIGMAFLQKGRAVYPSPLGTVESSVPNEAWDVLQNENPILGTMEPDVEALLVRRDGSHREAFIIPIDEGYRLVGLLRREWRGFTGGDGVQKALEEFFGELEARSGGAA
jgi:hypothetical protein